MPGRIAPLAMGWQRRMGGVAGPLSASGEASNDQPVQVEMWISGAWTDITAYVMVRDNSGSIQITRGRRDEGGTADHGTLSLLLNNRDGRWSPRNPSGVYYGQIGRNTPIRVSVPNGLGGKSYRFWGEVTAWPVGWDSTGTDVYVDLEASGIIRRLSQAPPSDHSGVYSSITDPDLTNLLAYWPCEDAKESQRIASALPNGSPMQFVVAPALAESELFGASDPLPVFTGAAMRGGVAAYADPTATQVRFLMYIPPEGASDLSVVVRITQLENISVADVRYFELFYNAPGGAYVGVATPGGLSLECKQSDGAPVGNLLHHTLDVRGRLLRVSIEMEESGANVTQTIRTLDLQSGVETTASQSFLSEQLTRVTSVAVGLSPFAVLNPDTAVGLPGGVIGHITVQDAVTPITDAGIRLSPVGEAAGRRVQRLCGEEGLAFDGIGDLDDSVTMGGQSRSNALELMREAELADDGMLFETTTALGLGYRTRASLINQEPRITLDYAAFHLSENVPQPVEDDRYIQNRVTVTVNGVSATREQTTGPLSVQLPPDGVGAYGQDITLNLENTSEAASQAAWRVFTGTIDEPRYPQISVNLARAPYTDNPALKQAALAVTPGDRLIVENMPSWLPPGDLNQIVLGVEESITYFEHRLTFVCMPAAAYTAANLDSDAARVDTDGSQLLESVSSGSAALSVTPSNELFTRWTTDSAEMPFDVLVGGEIMTVTAIANGVTDTFTRVTANGWGTADSGQAWSNVNAANSDFATTGTVATHSVGSVNSSRYSILSALSLMDVDLQADMATSVTATGGPHYSHVVARYINTNTMYLARLRFNTDQTIDLSLQKRVNGSQTDMVTVRISGTHAASTFFTVRFQCIGTTLRAKAWETGTTEPGWQATTTDGAITNAGPIGVRSVLDSANSNPLPVTFSYDNYLLLNPQLFTVTRSVNGVVKEQVAGEALSLANPTIVSL